MKIGDVVIPAKHLERGRYLHCGSGIYSHAIVGSVDPFVLVSSTGDMVWSTTWEPDEVQPLCQCSKEILDIVLKRLCSTGKHISQAPNDPADIAANRAAEGA